MVHEHDVKSPAVFVCAQSGCDICLERLVCHHEGLVHAVIRRSWVGTTAYDDLLQEGRLGLWRAVCGYEPSRGVAFSTYAWRVVERAVWGAVVREERQAGAPCLPLSPPTDPERGAMTAWQAGAIQAALGQALDHLSPRARHVICASYGLNGQTPTSLAALGRRYGVSREAVRIWRNQALVCLRLPALCARLSLLADQQGREAVRRRQGLTQAWQRQRRGRRP